MTSTVNVPGKCVGDDSYANGWNKCREAYLPLLAGRDARIAELEADRDSHQRCAIHAMTELAAIKAQEPVAHDTKGSRKALGAMNAKLKAKIGRLEREHAAPAAKPQVVIPELDREVFEDEYSGEYGTPVSVLRLLRDGENYIEKPQHSDRLNSSWWMWRKARALLSTPSPAGVDGLEVVATLLIDDPADQECGDWDIEVESKVAERMAELGGGQHDLCSLSDAKAIIDGLRGELIEERAKVAQLEEGIPRIMEASYQFRQQRDQLAGFLLAASKASSAAEVGLIVDTALAELPQ